MSEMAEIKGLIEEINPAIVELRSEVDNIKESQKDVITETKWDKMVSDITEKMEKMQDAQARMAAAQSRPGGDGDTDETKAAFDLFMRKGEGGEAYGMNKRMTVGPDEAKAMSTDVAPDGGYLVYPDQSAMVVSRIFETSPLRQLANIEQTTSTSVLMLIDDDEAGARWIGEGASGGETDTAQVGRKTIAVHKLEADPRKTVEQVMASYFDVEAWHARKVADKFARTENTAFVNGTGVDRPRGFLTYDAWSSNDTYERDKIAQINMGAAAALDADGLIEVQNQLKEDYQARATWGMKRSTFGAALKLKGTDNYFFSPVLLRDGQASVQLLGKPVVFMDDMPAVAANALSIVYADFQAAYTIVDGMNMTVLRDPFTNKGFITYYTTKGVGGDVTSFDAIKIGKVAA